MSKVSRTPSNTILGHVSDIFAHLVTAFVCQLCPTHAISMLVIEWTVSVHALDLRSRRPFTGMPMGPRPKVPQRVLLASFWPSGSECPKSAPTQKTLGALFRALQARWPKALQKHSLGHFRPGAGPTGSQHLSSLRQLQAVSKMLVMSKVAGQLVSNETLQEARKPHWGPGPRLR